MLQGALYCSVLTLAIAKSMGTMRLPVFLTGMLLGGMEICDLLLLSLPGLLDHLSPATERDNIPDMNSLSRGTLVRIAWAHG